EIPAEVLVELCLKSEAFRILVIDFFAAIVNVSLIRASLIGNDDIGVTVQEKAGRAEKSQVSREWSVSVEIGPPVQFQEFRANRTADDDRSRCAHMARDPFSG